MTKALHLLPPRARDDRDEAVLSLADYRRFLARLPAAFGAAVLSAFGRPRTIPRVRDGAFRFPIVRSGALVVALQPDRGRALEPQGRLPRRELAAAPRLSRLLSLAARGLAHRRHDPLRHAWHARMAARQGRGARRKIARPEIVLGAVPVIYPFIVNNPGEAAQAKRRIGAVTIGHMTPPLDRSREAMARHARARGAVRRICECAIARSAPRAPSCASDPRQGGRDRPRAKSSGSKPAAIRVEALAKLDAWLCDLKEMRIGDGLHVFADSTPSEMTGALARARRPLRRAGPGRRAVARAPRRVADRPQPLHHRSARRADAHRLGDRRAARRAR